MHDTYIRSLNENDSNTLMWLMSIEWLTLTLLTEFVQTDVNSDRHAMLTPANVNVT